MKTPLILASLLILAGCTVEKKTTVKEPADNSSLPLNDNKSGCTVYADPNDASTKIIECSDGSKASVHDGNGCQVVKQGNKSEITCGTSKVDILDGKDGKSCSVLEQTPEAVTIQCGDDPSFQLRKGIDGTNCSVESIANGARVTCGSRSVDLANGLNGKDGKSCSAKPITGGIAVQCGDDQAVNVMNGTNGQSCQVSSTDKGALVTCGANAVEIEDGIDGKSCSVKATTNGNEVKCGDDPAVVITNGKDGVNGTNGKDGVSCTARTVAEGTEIQCGNSIGLIRNGKQGAAGDSCDIQKDNAGKVIFSCANGGLVELNVVDGQIVAQLPKVKPFSFDPKQLKLSHAIEDLYPESKTMPRTRSFAFSAFDRNAIVLGQDGKFSVSTDTGLTYKNWNLPEVSAFSAINDAAGFAINRDKNCLVTYPLNGDAARGRICVESKISSVRNITATPTALILEENGQLSLVNFKDATTQRIAWNGTFKPVYLASQKPINGKLYQVITDFSKVSLLRVDLSQNKAETLAQLPAQAHYICEFSQADLFCQTTTPDLYRGHIDDNGLTQLPDLKASAFDADKLSLTAGYRDYLLLHANKTFGTSQQFMLDPFSQTTLKVPYVNNGYRVFGDLLLADDNTLGFLQLEGDQWKRRGEIPVPFTLDEINYFLLSNYQIDPTQKRLSRLEVVPYAETRGSEQKTLSFGTSNLQGRTYVRPWDMVGRVYDGLQMIDETMAIDFAGTDGLKVYFFRSKQSFTLPTDSQKLPILVKTAGAVYAMVSNSAPGNSYRLYKFNRDLDNVKDITPAGVGDATADFHGLAAAGDSVFLWSKGDLYVSNDAGNEFVKNVGPEVKATPASYLSFDGDNLIAGNAAVVALSQNQGKTWRRVDLPIDVAVNSLSIQRGYLFLNFVGNNKMIPMISADFGQSWAPVNHTPTTDTKRFTLTDNLLCFSDFDCAILQ